MFVNTILGTYLICEQSIQCIPNASMYQGNVSVMLYGIPACLCTYVSTDVYAMYQFQCITVLAYLYIAVTTY
jgi:hypothetical protein